MNAQRRTRLYRAALAAVCATLFACGAATDAPGNGATAVLQPGASAASVPPPADVNFANWGSADPVIKAIPAAARQCDAQGQVDRVAGPFRIYANNCVISLQLAKDRFDRILASGDFGAADLLEQFSRTFRDEFDFLVLSLDTGDSQPAPRFAYWGLYQSYGTRLPVRTRRMMGHIQLPFGVDPIIGGPFLHEMFHEWGQRGVLPNLTSDDGHWGFASTQGELGGFDLSTLKAVGNSTGADGRQITTYEAAVRPYLPAPGTPSAACQAFTRAFGAQSNLGNIIPYGPLELALMGLRPLSDLPALVQVQHPVWLGERLSGPNGPGGTSGSVTRFTGTGLVSIDAQTLKTRLGTADPDRQPRQNAFRVAHVTLTSRDVLDETAVAARRAEVLKMSLQDVPPEFIYGGCQIRYNVHSATQGLASIAFGGLREALR